MKNYTTKIGYQKMVDELNHLTTVEYRSAIDMLQEARDKGDLSENAEYDAAKEFHSNVMNKIAKLKEKIRVSEILSTDHLPADRINMLSTVEIKNHKMNAVQTFKLVSENEIDLKQGKISFNSPIGSALVGKKVGDLVDVQVPGGLMKLEVLRIIA